MSRRGLYMPLADVLVSHISECGVLLGKYVFVLYCLNVILSNYSPSQMHLDSQPTEPKCVVRGKLPHSARCTLSTGPLQWKGTKQLQHVI